MKIDKGNNMDTLVKNKKLNGKTVIHKIESPASRIDLKSTWSIRKVKLENYRLVKAPENYIPKVGDVAGVKVIKVANHSRIYSSENKYVQLYKDDIIFGVLGFRYATDAFHAYSIDINNLHLLTNAGLIGTVKDKHSSLSEPTRLELAGVFVRNNSNEILNLKTEFFKPARNDLAYPPVMLVIGTGMNSGKTTTAARLGRALIENGIKTALLKVTGSVSQRDIFEFESTGVNYTADFSDYGFPSTYLCNQDELKGLFSRMLEDTIPTQPDAVIIEIADGILQRETQMLLKTDIVRESCIGVVLTAPCSCSAITLSGKVKQLDYSPIAVTGIITNSPLFMQEFKQYDTTPVLDTQTNQAQFIDLIRTRLYKTVKL